MSKNDILWSLNYNKKQLASCRNQLRVLEEQYVVLDDFSRKCTTHINSFDESINRRKNRLLTFDEFLTTVKSASRYKQKMDDMLSGSEYSATVSAIDQLQVSISTEKRKISNDIQDLEDEIATLEVKVDNLQYQYDTYPEEVETDDN